jgi:hypothetical protein
MKTHMINRLFKLALFCVASPLMGAQTPFFTGIPEAVENPEPFLFSTMGVQTPFFKGSADALEAPEPLFVTVYPTKTLTKFILKANTTRADARLACYRLAEKFAFANAYDRKYKVVEVTYNNPRPGWWECRMTFSYLIEIRD